jgi:phytol kinase
METIDRGVQHVQESRRVGPSGASRPLAPLAWHLHKRNADAKDWPADQQGSLVSRPSDTRVANHVFVIGDLDRTEIRRRICHMLPGLLAFLLPLIPHPHPLPALALMRLTILASLLALGVILLFRAIARPDEQHCLLNVISYPAAIIAILLMFPGHPEFGSVVLVVLAFGDGSATLFGLLKRGRPLPWNAKKTWLGTLAFLFCATPLSALAYWQESRPHVSVGVALAIGVITTLIAGIVESIPLRVSDNFRVGLAAMFGVVAAHAGFLGWS